MTDSMSLQGVGASAEGEVAEDEAGRDVCLLCMVFRTHSVSPYLSFLISINGIRKSHKML